MTGRRTRPSEVARAQGVNHIISLRNRRGLATAFTTGIDAALKLGADFIVNTDGDNQYSGQDIPALVAPLVNGDADIVIGDRNVAALAASFVDAENGCSIWAAGSSGRCRTRACRTRPAGSARTRAKRRSG